MILTAPHSKAAIILVHGMQEYSDRYQGFCQYLQENGYSNIRYDLLGHGKKIAAEKRGYFGVHGWQNLLEQLHEQVKTAHQEFSGQPVILFGHSMGTLIIRSYLQHYQDFDGMVLTGSPYYNSLWRLGKILSRIIIAAQGPHNTSGLLSQLTTGGFNKNIKKPRTDFDWLCYNRADVQAYIQDAGCGFPFTNQGYSDLYDGMGELAQLKHFTSQHPVPALLLSGKDDPCAGNFKQVSDSVNTLKNAGYQDLTAKTYPHMRHEILFEKDKDLVEKDIIHWLDRKFAQ